MKVVIDFFRNLFTGASVGASATKVVRKSLSLRPTEDSLLTRQQELMITLFYGPMKALAIPGADNSYSFGYKKDTGRVKFTARGAFLHRTDIDEPNLFDIKYYLGGNNITTAPLTQYHKNQDRELFHKTVTDIILGESPIDIDITFLEQADREAVAEMDGLQRMWRLYLDCIYLIPLYMYEIKDLTFVTERLFRAIFKAIALEELMKECDEKETMRIKTHEDIFLAAQACMFPLSLNAYTQLRNSLPKTISDRMSTVKFKLKMIQLKRYDSPYGIAQVKGY